MVKNSIKDDCNVLKTKFYLDLELLKENEKKQLNQIVNFLVLNLFIIRHNMRLAVRSMKNERISLSGAGSNL